MGFRRGKDELVVAIGSGMKRLDGAKTVSRVT